MNTTNDPRNKLAIAHMVLYRLAHNQFIDPVSMENGLKEIDNFIDFLNQTRGAPSVADKIVELLQPARRIIEIHLNNESSIREMIEVALSDFDKAIGMVGDIQSWLKSFRYHTKTSLPLLKMISEINSPQSVLF